MARHTEVIPQHHVFVGTVLAVSAGVVVQTLLADAAPRNVGYLVAMAVAVVIGILGSTVARLRGHHAVHRTNAPIRKRGAHMTGLHITCGHCSEQIVVYYLRPGELAYCAACSHRTLVPSSATLPRIPSPLLSKDDLPRIRTG